MLLFTSRSGTCFMPHTVLGTRRIQKKLKMQQPFRSVHNSYKVDTMLQNNQETVWNPQWCNAAVHACHTGYGKAQEDRDRPCVAESCLDQQMREGSRRGFSNFTYMWFVRKWFVHMWLYESNHFTYNKNSLCNINVAWQPRRVDWNARE